MPTNFYRLYDDEVPVIEAMLSTLEIDPVKSGVSY